MLLFLKGSLTGDLKFMFPHESISPEYSGAWRKLIHGKNLKSKISCQAPFKHWRRTSKLNLKSGGEEPFTAVFGWGQYLIKCQPPCQELRTAQSLPSPTPGPQVVWGIFYNCILEYLANQIWIPGLLKMRNISSLISLRDYSLQKRASIFV